MWLSGISGEVHKPSFVPTMSPSNDLLVLLVHYLLSKLIDEKGHCGIV